MTDITHEQIRDLLPDALHASLDDARRKQIEDHLHSCAECASEMRVLQMVKNAPSFAPMIDAVKVSSRILPYGGVPAEPARPKTRAWTMLAAVAAVVVIGVAVISRGSSTVVTPSSPAAQVAVASTNVETPAKTVKTKLDSPVNAVASAAPKSRELQVAVGLDDLSDGSLKQLASELDGLDGLPSAELENIEVTDANTGTGGGQ